MEKINIEKVDSVKLYKIRKMLEELSQKSGRGTELISVYIPKGKQLHEIISTLQQKIRVFFSNSLRICHGHQITCL